jgi:hypothetical protein
MWERLGLPEVRAHTTRLASHLKAQVSLKRLLDESPWLQFTSECQRF